MGTALGIVEAHTIKQYVLVYGKRPPSFVKSPQQDLMELIAVIRNPASNVFHIAFLRPP